MRRLDLFSSSKEADTGASTWSLDITNYEPATAISTFSELSIAMDNRLEEVQDIFRDVFDQPDLVVTRESSAYTIDGWDSLAHINLVTAIEKHYKIRFALGELQDLNNIGDMLDLIHRQNLSRDERVWMG